MNPNDLIPCITFNGAQRMVPRASLTFRPSVYGIIVRDGNILMTKEPRSGHYWFPGGGVEAGESYPEALTREIREEAGLDATVNALVLQHDFCYYGLVQDSAEHILMRVYECTVMDGDLRGSDPAEVPQWIPLRDLETIPIASTAQPVLSYIRERYVVSRVASV